jgi:hypothetical protein
MTDSYDKPMHFNLNNRSPSAPPATGIMDTNLVAYLKLKGHPVIPWINEENHYYQISFDVEGDSETIQSDLHAFYNNEQVGIQDFCRAVKEVKSEMHAMKRMAANRK